MSTPLGSSLRRAAAVAALGAVAARATIAATAMSGCSKPPSGVHVVVTMSDADYDDDHAFDHLTVTARVGARTAGACLYPEDAVERAVELDGGAGAYACADRRTQPWAGLPTARGWALETQPPSINVEAAEDEEVEIVVTGGLGGHLGTVGGSGTMRASSAFPELRVELRAGEPLLLGECEARLEPSFPPELGVERPLCDAGVDPCPGKVQGSDPLRSSAVFCIGPEGSQVSRVLNGPGDTCPDGGHEGGQVVWRSAGSSVLGGDCVRVFTTGRFVRCVEGDPHDPGGCTVTTECTPPGTAAVVRAKSWSGPDAGWSLPVDVSCLPPMGVPITWSVERPRPGAQVVFGVAQEEIAADAGSCFLDVHAIALKDGPCSAP